MVEIARMHSNTKILESIQKLHPTIDIGPGKVTGVEVDDASANRRPRTVSVTIEYVLSPKEFTQVLDDSLVEPDPLRRGVIL